MLQKNIKNKNKSSIISNDTVHIPLYSNAVEKCLTQNNDFPKSVAWQSGMAQLKDKQYYNPVQEYSNNELYNEDNSFRIC